MDIIKKNQICHEIFSNIPKVMPKVLYFIKVEKILKCSLHLIPSPSVKIQIIGKKVCLRCKGKTLFGGVNKLLNTASLLRSPSNVLPIPSSKLSHTGA